MAASRDENAPNWTPALPGALFDTSARGAGCAVAALYAAANVVGAPAGALYVATGCGAGAGAGCDTGA